MQAIAAIVTSCNARAASQSPIPSTVHIPNATP
jgi:hypothetical protein